jgi:hypothetical protein
MTTRRLLAALLLFAAAGCGSPEAPKGSGTPSGKDALTDLGVLLKEFGEQKKRPPAKAADIEPVEPLHQAAYVGLVRGDIVYVWGAPLSGGSDVIAFEKQADTAGGWVLLQDGTVKEMIADQFRAAPRAKK